jgi:hypothetical protein
MSYDPQNDGPVMSLKRLAEYLPSNLSWKAQGQTMPLSAWVDGELKRYADCPALIAYSLFNAKGYLEAAPPIDDSNNNYLAIFAYWRGEGWWQALQLDTGS